MATDAPKAPEAPKVNVSTTDPNDPALAAVKATLNIAEGTDTGPVLKAPKGKTVDFVSELATGLKVTTF